MTTPNQNSPESTPTTPSKNKGGPRKTTVDLAMAKRLKAVRRAKDVSQRKLGEMLLKQNAQAAISKWERGQNPITRNVIDEYVRLFEVNPDYIVHGTLPMFRKVLLTDKSPATDYVKAVQVSTKGNIAYVAPHSIGSFVEGVTPDQFRFPLDLRDLTAFPIVTGDLGPDYPKGSYVFTIEVGRTMFQMDSMYVVVTKNELLIRRYIGMLDNKTHYRLAAVSSHERLIALDDIEHLYFVTARYLPTA